MSQNSLVTRTAISGANQTETRVTGTTYSTKRALDVSVAGGEIIDVGGLMDGAVYDYVGVTLPNSVAEVYAFKTGGSGGTLVATVTVVYTDANKTTPSSVTRT